jgi:hypothetical protein
MLKSAALFMGLVVLICVSNASAALVNFKGVLTSNPTPPTGSLNLPLGDFELSLTTGVPLATSLITGGQFKFGATVVNVAGGTVGVSGGNTLSFTVLATPNVIASFTFSGLSGLGGTVNQATLDKLYPPVVTTTFSILQTDPSGGTVLAQYDGTISSVPEPSSMIALAGLAVGAGGWRLRKRKLAAAQ